MVLFRCRLPIIGLAAAGGLLISVASGGASNALAQPTKDSASIAMPASTSAPNIEGVQTKPVYSYETAIRESVKVDTALDTDADGVHDTVAVDIVRPREPALGSLKIPVIMDASPYYKCCGRGNEGEKKSYDAVGVISKMPLFYDNYFVPRGYGVVQVDIVGTSRSTGCGDVGGSAEIASVVAVIDWLNGRNTARSLSGTPVVANWTTGAVGMIGKSYDGTLANGVAATGVQGLKTIVPISAISSWYDYTRSDGVPHSLDYLPWLAGEVGHDTQACKAVRHDLGAEDEDATGNYTDFWAERDYVKDAGKVKASVFVVHGLSDYNVETRHFSQWWEALGRHQVPRKIWLGVEDHVDPFEFRRSDWVSELHKWFDYWLMGLPNQVMNEPIADVETAPDTWVQYSTWPQDVAATAIPLSVGKLGANAGGTVSLTDDSSLTEAGIVGTPTAQVPGRQMFLSAPLGSPIRISGTPTATLRIRSNKKTTPVSVRLIEYGQASRYAGMQTSSVETCWGLSSVTDDACYFEATKLTATTDHGIVGRGWIDAAHSDSLSNPTLLTPGQWTTVTVPLRAQDMIVPSGRILGLAVSLGDTEWTTPNDKGATVEIDLSQSRLNMNLSGGQVVAAAGPAQLDITVGRSPSRERRLPLN